MSTVHTGRARRAVVVALLVASAAGGCGLVPTTSDDQPQADVLPAALEPLEIVRDLLGQVT